MADGNELDPNVADWLNKAKGAAGANDKKVWYYNTRIGPANIVYDQKDPTRAWYEGDNDTIPIDEDLDAAPVYHEGAPADETKFVSRFGTGVPVATNAHPAARTNWDRFMGGLQESLRSAAQFDIDPWQRWSQGPTLGDAIFPQADPEGAAQRRQFLDDLSARRLREQADHDILAAQDPWEGSKDRVGAAAATIGGYFAGSLPDPLNLLEAGAGVVSRALFQGGVQMGQDAIVQGQAALFGTRKAYTTSDQVQIGKELAKLAGDHSEAGVAKFNQAIDQADTLVADGAHKAAPFDWAELGLSGLTGSVTQAGVEGLGHGVKAVFSPIVDAYLRGVHARDFARRGDPALAALAKDKTGAVAPGQAPVDQAFAEAPGWLRELAPAIEKAAIHPDPRVRADAYGEILARLREAADYGEDPHDLGRALDAARLNDALPDLKAFDAISGIARDVGDGKLASNKLKDDGQGLAALVQRFDPSLAADSRAPRRMAGALKSALNDLDISRQLGQGDRPPREVVVGDQSAPLRTTTDDEIGDVDTLANQALAIPRSARNQPKPLTRFVIRKGGLKDVGGDVEEKIRGLTRKDGLEIEDMAMRAWDEGYFPDHSDNPPTPAEFVDALNSDARGERQVYADGDQGDVDLMASQRDLLHYLEGFGVDTRITDPNALRREIAAKVYGATYAKSAGEEGAAAGAPPATSDKSETRTAPPGWGGARKGQSAGASSGGAAVAPLQRMRQFHTPIPRQTWLRKQLRAVKRRGGGSYTRDVIDSFYTAIIEAQHTLVVQQQRLVREIEKLTGATWINGKAYTTRLNLKPSENPALLARLSRDGYSSGHLDLHDGVRPYRQPNVKASPSFREAVETALGGRDWAGEHITDFENYLIARRGVKAWDRYNRGELPRPPHAMNQQDLADAVRQGEGTYPGFKEGAEKLYAFLDALWQKKRDAGLITDEQFQKAKQEDYVPFLRDMDAPDPGGASSPGKGDAKNKSAAFKRFRGSDRKILSPLSSIMADVYNTSDRIARNESYRALADLADKARDLGSELADEILKPLPRSMDKTKIDVVDEVKAALRKQGADPQDIDNLAGAIDTLLDGETAATVYRAGDVIEGGRKVIYVWRDGTRQAYELTDPDYADDLFKAMTGLTQESRDLFLDMVSIPTQALRTAITASPGFQFANLFRDALSSWMLTDVGLKPGEALVGAGQVLAPMLPDGMKNWLHATTGLTPGKTALLYNAVGTMGGGMVRAAMPRTHMQRDLPALRGKVFSVRSLHIGTLWRGFEHATELSENATRIRLFGRAFEKGKRAGMSDDDASKWAAYESRDYLDFQRSGSKMLNARRIVLFLNASLQGMDRTFRTMGAEGNLRDMLVPLTDLFAGRKEWSTLTPDDKYKVGRAYKLWVKMGMLGTFGLMLTALNATDDDYQYGFSDYTKNNYWLIRAGHYWVSVPKPFDLAIFSNLAERCYEGTFGKDPLAWQRLVDGLGQTYLPPSEITAAALPLQLANNKTNTGAPIVPMGVQGLAPHLQYTATTSQMSIDFARGVFNTTGIEVSPAQLDHIFNGVFGDFFRSPATALSAAANPNAPEVAPSDFTPLNRFLREPGRGGTPARTHFYDQAMADNAKLSVAANTLSYYLEKGDLAGASKLIATMPADQRDFAELTVGFQTDVRRLHPMLRAKNVVTEIGRLRKELGGGDPGSAEEYFLPQLTPHERRVALEALDDISSAEMQAAMVLAGTPGFKGRAMMDVDGRYERLKAVSPATYSLLRVRLLTGRERAYNFDTVRANWAEVQTRLHADGFNADFSDLASEAQGDFGDAGLYQDELEARGGKTELNREQKQEEQDLKGALAGPGQ